MTKIYFFASLKNMKRRHPWIPVVTGLMMKNGDVLLGQRPPGNSLPGQWEFPGGKIELGESPEQALKRELMEELGIDAEIGSLRLANTHSYGDRGVLLLFYDVSFWKGEPKPSHHAQLRWVKPKELLTLEIPEANRRIVDVLLSILK